MISIKYSFKRPKDNDGELEGHRLSKKKQEDFTANGKVEYHLLSVLLVQDINRASVYNSAKEL